MQIVEIDNNQTTHPSLNHTGINDNVKSNMMNHGIKSNKTKCSRELQKVKSYDFQGEEREELGSVRTK